jgi:hypothetical protein
MLTSTLILEADTPVAVDCSENATSIRFDGLRIMGGAGVKASDLAAHFRRIADLLDAGSRNIVDLEAYLQSSGRRGGAA